MTLRKKEYYRPEDWLKAHQLLNRVDIHTAPLIIGPRPVALADLDADALVDLQKLQLDAIQKSQDERVHLGALATLQNLYQSDLLQSEAGGILVEAAHVSATLGVRNVATVAGALASPEGPPEVALALMALDAVVVAQQAEGETRHIPLHEWIEAGNKALKRGEVVVEVNFQSRPSAAGALARVGRTPRDLAIVAAAAVVELENGVIRRVGLSLAGANPIPVCLVEIEKWLAGRAVSEALLDEAAARAVLQANPVGDYRGSSEYRSAMAGVLARRALAAAIRSAGKA